MTFIRRFQLRNRHNLIREAGEIAESQEKDKKRFVLILKLLLVPIFAVLKTIKMLLLIPVYVCVGIGSAFEYLAELLDDLYHVLEDSIFLVLKKIMKVKTNR